jgi:hypothetical protein
MLRGTTIGVKRQESSKREGSRVSPEDAVAGPQTLFTQNGPFGGW